MNALKVLILASTALLVSSDVTCQDQQSSCPDGMTCCQLSTGEYGCCPMPQAVCCTDKIHCCPHGTKCDTAHSQCLNPLTGRRTPWVGKQPANPISTTSIEESTEGSEENENSIICPDQLSQCPDETTCCMLTSGAYGCCPMPKATCCTDHVHCCPHATKCNLTQQTCVRRDGSTVPLSRKRASTRRPNVIPPPHRRMRDTQCPDQKSSCPDGSTCCKLSPDEYGCCPLPQAVCCDDYIHCCPQGTTCNTEQGSCDQANGDSVPWVEKRSAFVIQPIYPVQDEFCADYNTTCVGGTSCCRGVGNSWSCCPYVNGVCCRDRRHCCPSSSRCDMNTGACKMGDYALKWAETESGANRGRIDCEDGSNCPATATCCLNSNGHHYSCCPTRNAVCCNGYCCPKGYQCGFGANSCIRDIFKPKRVQLVQP